MRTAFLFAVLGAALVVSSCYMGTNGPGGHVGRIVSIDPPIPYVRDTVTAHGFDFGSGHMAGAVRCGGTQLHMVSWTDTAVCFIAPDSAFTGNLEIQCNCGGTASATFPMTVRSR